MVTFWLRASLGHLWGTLGGPRPSPKASGTSGASTFTHFHSMIDDFCQQYLSSCAFDFFEMLVLKKERTQWARWRSLQGSSRVVRDLYIGVHLFQKNALRLGRRGRSMGLVASSLTPEPDDSQWPFELVGAAECFKRVARGCHGYSRQPNLLVIASRA